MNPSIGSTRSLTRLALAVALAVATPAQERTAALAQVPDPVPKKLQRWLGAQVWTRDTKQPALALGAKGAFDDNHIFAPMVAVDGGRFLMWYCGSSGTAHDLAKQRVPDLRVFRLGLATSADGKVFARHPDAPVMALESGRSILTPTILRNADGSLVREDGKIRMWFSSAAFRGDDRVHAIQDATSTDGVKWSKPSPRQLLRAYAPSVIKTGDGYEMWYTKVSRYPWVMLHARSDDGRKWKVTPQPVLEISQSWEHFLQIYPNVMLVDGVYLMWYASYATEDRVTTAVGFAVSVDGVKWYKHPKNPVLRADSSRPWESHYVSSQSVIRLADGSFRVFYASRKKPPFRNLYFALNTATWPGPKPKSNDPVRRRR